ncbi:MAG: SRPBCC family protein, partial [Alphaproteobacteria bacterium]|nr:SRPBCC family protein [Alphaproteobacteria bacterium]
MTKVSVAVDFDAPPREVWEIIGDFNALPRWHPGIAGSRIEYGEEGTQRVLKSPDGSEFIERFVGAN